MTLSELGSPSEYDWEDSESYNGEIAIVDKEGIFKIRHSDQPSFFLWVDVSSEE